MHKICMCRGCMVKQFTTVTVFVIFSLNNFLLVTHMKKDITTNPSYRNEWLILYAHLFHLKVNLQRYNVWNIGVFVLEYMLAINILIALQKYDILQINVSVFPDINWNFNIKLRHWHTLHSWLKRGKSHFKVLSLELAHLHKIKDPHYGGPGLGWLKEIFGVFMINMVSQNML